MNSADRLESAYQTALAALLKERTPQGHWVGELSTSALSTATAVMALYLVGKNDSSEPHKALTVRGLGWLAANQNADGGWGDTTKSFSNISTTMLCRAAFYVTGTVKAHAETVNKAETWLFARHGNTPEQLARAVRERYGKDRTFATPILTTCALAGLVDWKEVPPLPFELAILPQVWFRFLRLHVVSYALPALIAIGRVIEYHKKPRNPLTRLLRALSRAKSLRVLEKIQPTSGGFLEAIPLTSFVTLSLAACGLAQHPVARKGVDFLVNAVLADGSWAIDSDLATWVTTLSINALSAAGELESLAQLRELREWLLQQQYRDRHAYTGAGPGGWAWTPLPGGVPDADDTAGAVLALAWDRHHPAVRTALASAQAWLRTLQNGDGGVPTFCRGWGQLPFDRSGCDLTAHALRGVAQQILDWKRSPLSFNPESPWFLQFGEWCLVFLQKRQRPDGSWLPLWFGNQHAPDDENPTYGTARVLAAYRDLGIMNTEPARRGVAWLLSVQNADGGWGGALNTPSSMEETALAVEILVDAGPQAGPAMNKGLAWLVEHVEQGGLYNPSPIGFYFAKLWYFEKLYPIIFTVAALGRARRRRALVPPDKSLGSLAEPHAS